MLVYAFASLLTLPLVSAGVHKLKLQKLPTASHDLAQETAHLAHKYGGMGQTPLVGTSSGRHLRYNRPSQNENGESLLWTQDEFNGGHQVPLSSACI